MRGFRWTCGVLFALALPVGALATGLAYLVLRRRWSDRLVAALVVAVGAAATWWAMGTLSYWTAWLHIGAHLVRLSDRPASAGEWTTVVGIGLTLGPALGGVLWLGTQAHRERSPFDGADEREHRRLCEERRRLVVTHLAQRARHTGRRPVAVIARPLAVEIGDGRGPIVGRFQRGDLRGAWRVHGRVRLPMNSPNNRHLLILGATGLGKTETALTIAEWAARHGRQVIYLTCKEPPSTRKSVAPRLAAAAAEHRLRFRALTARTAPYDPMRGDLAEVRDRLIRIEEWGDRYWAAVANTLVALALELNAEQDRKVDALPDLVYSLVRGRLANLAKKSSDPRVAELVEAFNYTDLGGALMRYASMAIHLRGWIGPASAGGWSFEDTDIACIELPTVSRPEAATALMRLILRDFGAYLVDPRRRQVGPDGQPKPVVIVIEEAGAVSGDPVIGREFVNQVERNRDAGAYSVLTAQDPTGFGGGHTWSALSTNAVVMTYRQSEQAEPVAKLAGTERVTEGGADYDTDNTLKSQGVARRQHAFKVNPQMLRTLGVGEFVLISAGRYAKVAAALSRLSFRLPSVPAVHAAVEAIESARVAAALPTAEAKQADTDAHPGGDNPVPHGPILF
ncbi:type IV secretory system conjugative DNA transfer family protein [Couchioplanes caeruleus]|uniref:AAA+ ATPase domain-containing protein n=2 Tax=Couchioplanes caeruleus TaxID=56438 RepID=A0A1K0FJT2_9ACTN|nr:hypothetical protein [Couchioplanes caeruleus]OJF13089.1 hypothetical protein BG844_17160 [Couchioplanes caeruleus subsp. caeruleus]ROP29518.1 hypothetical protein EDD30_2315 [Couchioplanes caeruleus]